MRTYTFLTWVLVSVNIFAQNPQISERLTVQWETGGFDTPESVLFDAKSNIYYVSNIGGKNPTEKDKNGFISKLNKNGTIESLKWVEGLNAPKGMAIIEGDLYVSDIDNIVKIDIATGTVSKRIPVEGATFLNDIAVLDNGDLLVSDSKNNGYIQVKNDIYSPFSKDNTYTFPNGLVVYKGIIYTGVGDRVVKIDQKTKESTDFITNTGSVDGIAVLGENEFVVSLWKGVVKIVSPNGKVETLLDTTSDPDAKTADFELVERNILIPTFFKNTVVCYTIN